MSLRFSTRNKANVTYAENWDNEESSSDNGSFGSEDDRDRASAMTDTTTTDELTLDQVLDHRPGTLL